MTNTTQSMKTPSAWPKYLPGIVVVALCGWLYQHSIGAMLQTWAESKTYAHGYLVLPIVLFLVWRKRETLSATPVTPLIWVNIVLLLMGVCWVIARLFAVQVVEQMLFVSMIHVLIIAMYGVRIYKVILFPLCYLFFAVPMGEIFVPKLMQFTADFTVAALKLSGIPVFREGMYFSIPAGDFEVAKACSGIRYLMASFTLGTLFAYLTFRTLKKQLLFAAASLLVPIVANAFRAYGIVLIAHWSDMQYAVGVDHLIYGWLFFGIVMFVLFYIGGRFRDDEDFADSHMPVSNASNDLKQSTPTFRIIGLVVVIASLTLPRLIYTSTLKSAGIVSSSPQLPVARTPWTGPEPVSSPFIPGFTGYESSVSGRYQRQAHSIHLWAYRYRPFSQNVEMINAMNRLVSQKEIKVIDSRRVTINNVAGIQSVIEHQLRINRQDYLVWYWYQFDQRSAASEVHAKLLEGWSWLTGGFQVNEAITVIVIKNQGDAPRAELHRYVTEYYDQLASCVFVENPNAMCTTGNW